ncbi:hypothetical protein VNO77_26987 [Canavalia gladiata]|uniref:Uncharacterized protein n=1 Tax=Canavalia gladiata TaxID=3824 RepID=A0AAN9Q3T7_CANGL
MEDDSVLAQHNARGPAEYNLTVQCVVLRHDQQNLHARLLANSVSQSRSRQRLRSLMRLNMAPKLGMGVALAKNSQ